MTDLETAIANRRARIKELDDYYYRNSVSKISDREYDKLKAELQKHEEEFALFTRSEASPTKIVGDDRLAGFERYRHLLPLQSLDNTYNEDEYRAFHQRLAKELGREALVFVVEPKIDGLAVSVTYEKGRLVRAATRGDGVEGDDITENVRTIQSLPKTLMDVDGLSLPETIEIRGEIYLTIVEFQRINREREAAGEPIYANPRNLASGTIKQLDSKEVARRKLEIVLYGLGFCEREVAKSQTDFLLLLKRWGLPTVERSWSVVGAEAAWRAVCELDKLRNSFAYGTDGAVTKLDSFALRREAGSTVKAPRWAIAFKFAAERAETLNREITIQVGRTGVLTPVAELAPVLLAGSTVARATLHNGDEISRKDIRVGDFVLVEKAGEVIPALVEVNLERRSMECRQFVLPENCPICGSAVVQLENESALRCPNQACPAQVRRRLAHFASKACLDIDGLGDAMVDDLVERGWVKELPDIFRLKREHLLSLGKNVDKSTDNLLASIEAAKKVELWRLIHGLGIPHVGSKASRDLAMHFREITRLVNARLGDFVEGKNSVITGIGETMSRAIVRFFEDERNRNLVRDLLEAGVSPEVSNGIKVTGTNLANMVFVLTGTLPTLKREDAEQKILAAGGKVSSSVSKKTSYVLAGAEAGSKLEKAQALGVPVLDEAEFLRLLAGG